MAFGNSAVGLLFEIEAKDNASAEIAKISKLIQAETSTLGSKGSSELDKLTGATGATATGFGSMAGAAGIAGAAIGTLVSATIGGAAALFSIAKSASDFGSAIKDVSDKTGLGAESISTLKLAADQSGSSLEAISGSVTKFSKLIGDSAEGSDKATNSLKRLGLDPVAALKDLDGSLETVFKRIYDAKNPIVATKLATEAFGKSGADLIPVIKQMNGDFAAFKEEAKRLGVVLTDADAQAADDFGDSLTALQAQAQGIAFTFAKEFLPDITGAMQSVSQSFADNKDTVIAWGNAVKGLIKSFGDLIGFLEEHSTAFRIIAGITTFGISEATIDQFKRLESTGAAIPTVSGTIGGALGRKTRTIGAGDDGGLGDADRAKEAEKAQKAAEDRQKKREDAFKKEINAQSAQNKLLLKSDDEGYQEVQKQAVAQFAAKQISQDQFLTGSEKNLKEHSDYVRELLKNAFELDKQGKTGTELQNAVIEYQNAVKALDRKDAQERLDLQKTVTDAAKKESGEREGIAENELKNKLEILRAESDKELAIIAQSNSVQKQLKSSRIADEQKLKTDAVRDELELNKQLLASSDLSPEKRAEINQRIAILDLELATQKINASVLVREAIDKETAAQDEAARKATENLTRIKLEILKTQNDLKSVQNQTKRDSITDSLNSGTLGTKEKRDALIALRDFDIAENNRRAADAISEANQQHDLELSKVKDKDKEKDQVDEINKLLERRIELINAERDANAGKINADTQKPIDQAATNASGGGFLGGVLSGAGIGAEDLLKKVEPLKTIGDIIGGQFDAIAGAVGNAVKSFVLFGTAGGSFRKFAAEVIASVAQMSVVQAVFELAQGFAGLALSYFTGNPKYALASGAHFTAAAIFGTVAGVSAVAGRGVAGNSFAAQGSGSSASSSFQSQTAGGQNSNNQKEERKGTDTPGGYYSSETDVRTFEENRLRNQKPQKMELTLKIESKDSHIVGVVRKNIQELSDIHGAIVNVVQQTT